MNHLFNSFFTYTSTIYTRHTICADPRDKNMYVSVMHIQRFVYLWSTHMYIYGMCTLYNVKLIQGD